MNVPHVNVNPALFFLECKVFFNVVTVDTVYSFAFDKIVATQG